jgi:hypothetical protein
VGRRRREEGGGGLGMVCARLGFQGKKEQRGLGQWKNWRGARAEGVSRHTEGRRGRGWGRGEATVAQVFTYQVLFSFSFFLGVEIHIFIPSGPVESMDIVDMF